MALEVIDGLVHQMIFEEEVFYVRGTAGCLWICQKRKV